LYFLYAIRCTLYAIQNAKRYTLYFTLPALSLSKGAKPNGSQSLFISYIPKITPPTHKMQDKKGTAIFAFSDLAARRRRSGERRPQKYVKRIIPLPLYTAMYSSRQGPVILNIQPTAWKLSIVVTMGFLIFSHFLHIFLRILRLFATIFFVPEPVRRSWFLRSLGEEG
jgi:hypothetical protein